MTETIRLPLSDFEGSFHAFQIDNSSHSISADVHISDNYMATYETGVNSPEVNVSLGLVEIQVPLSVLTPWIL